ncbi:hypothetical protein ACIPRL_08070 [Streptomyces sp. NPDC090085]|uniref:hypothetical protein n=1 Tax=Streptomyces sp. NPDC090085 TaxID=3365943 RepID=UPI0038047ACB
MREYTVRCDSCREAGDSPANALVLDIAIRVTDPENPDEPRLITGTLDECAEHTDPVDQVAALITKHGVPLDPDARLALALAIGARDTDGKALHQVKDVRYLCPLCPPGTRSIAGPTRSTHARRTHQRKASAIAWRTTPDA